MNKRLYIYLWLACVVGSWAVFPYLIHAGIIPPEVPILQLFLMTTAWNVLLFGVACWLSYLLVPKTDLSPFSLEEPVKNIVYPGLIAGVGVGLVLYLSDQFLFQRSGFVGAHPPFWLGAIASIYGAVNEEVLMRLFLLTFLYFLLGKAFRVTENNRTTFLWISTVTVALAFGLGHLPAAYSIGVPTSTDIFRILLLNGLAGMVFGWFYWTRGLWTAMFAHFVADLMVHVFLV